MYKIKTAYAKALLFIVTCMVANTLYANSEIHKPFNDVLSTSVANGKVDYRAIKDNPSFSSYVESLKTKATFTNQNEALAYWINSYNALVIQGILDGGSPSTFFGRKSFFKGDIYQLAGMKINLNDLERKVIIPIGEPRIHFAINCASSSCPKLIPEVYNAEIIDQQLTQAAKAFINDTMRNHFDPEMKIASISKIFDWFEEDFINHSGSVEKYLAQYVNDENVADDLRAGNYKIKYLHYDWSLNGTKP